MKVGPTQSLSVSGDLYFWPGRPVRSAITVGAGADGAAGAVFRDTATTLTVKMRRSTSSRYIIPDVTHCDVSVMFYSKLI